MKSTWIIPQYVQILDILGPDVPDGFVKSASGHWYHGSIGYLDLVDKQATQLHHLAILATVEFVLKRAGWSTGCSHGETDWFLPGNDGPTVDIAHGCPFQSAHLAICKLRGVEPIGESE